MGYYGHIPATGDDNNFKILDDISSFTATFDGSSIGIVTAANDTIKFTDHRFITGQRVKYTNGGGGDIGGLTNNGFFFIIKNDNNTIKLATTAARANAGTAINITALGTGSSHTLNVAFDGVNTKFKSTYGGGNKSRITRGSQLVISINGVIQQPSNSPTPSNGFGIASNSVIVFSVAPVATDAFWGHILTNNNVSFDITDNVVDNFTGDNSTTEFSLSKQPVNSQNLLVTLDGVIQYPSDSTTTRAYTVIANILQFVGAPGTGVEIQARHIGFAGAASGGGGEVTGFYGRTGNVSLTNTDDITVRNITGQHLNLTGVSTFASTVDINSNVDVSGSIDVDGQTTLDDLNVSGVSTFASNLDINNNVDVSGFIDVDGQTTLDDLNVSGISTLAQLKMGSVTATAILDEDNMASNSATSLATQQSIKAYVDNQVTAQDLDVTSDSGTIAIDLDSETLSISGTSNEIETSATGNAVTVGLPNNVTVSGNLTVGGVLQYEDVVNIDSIGVVTARSDIHIGDKIVHIGDTNTALRFPTADTITAEVGGSEITRITSSGLGINVTPNRELHVKGLDAIVRVESTSATGRNVIEFFDSSAAKGSIGWPASGNDHMAIQQSENADMWFSTNDTERLRIKSDGDVDFTSTTGNSVFTFKKGDSPSGEETVFARFDRNGTVIGGIGGPAQISGSSGGDMGMAAVNSNNLVFGTGSGGAATERLRITSGGQVNIGGNYTQTFNALDVTGNIKASARLNANDAVFIWQQNRMSLGNSFIIESQQNTPFAILTQAVAQPIVFGTNSTERLRIVSDGRVLIGTSSGATAGSTNNALFTICGAVDSAANPPQMNLWRNASINSGNELGAINFCGESGTGVPGAIISAQADAEWNTSGDASDHPGRLIFSTTPDGSSVPTEALRITSGGQSHFSGSVKIGSGNATGIHNLAKVLEISGGDGGDLIIGNDASSNIGAGAHIGAIAFKNIDNSTGSAPHYAGIRCEAVDTSGNMDLRFYTGIANLEADTPQFTMRGSNLGIGENTPTSLLHVSGGSSPTILNKPSDATPALFVGDSNRTGAGQHLAEYRGNWNGTSVARMVFAAGGDTTNKDEGQMMFYTAPSGTMQERFRIYSNGACLIGSDSGGAGGNARLSIDCESRNVLADVTEAINYGLIFCNESNSNTANGIGFFNDDGNNCGGYIIHEDKGSNNVGDIIFATAESSNNPQQRMRIHNNGRISIGKASAECTLDIDSSHYVITNSGRATTGINIDGTSGNADEYGGGISFQCGATGAAAVAGLQGGSDADNVGLAFFTHPSGTGSADAKEQMRITSGGTVICNNSSGVLRAEICMSTSGHKFVSQCDNNDDGFEIYQQHGSTTSRNTLAVYDNRSGSRGLAFAVRGDGETFLHPNDLSDRALKDNITDMASSYTQIKNLRPVNFNWKGRVDTEGNPVVKSISGFIAQEVEEQIPNIINGEEGGKAINSSGLVAHVTKALQEAISKIETLEAKVAALESS